LDDPTRSTERAKITGPRKIKPKPKGGLKLIVWIAAICVIIAAIVTTVMVMMVGKAKEKAIAAEYGSGSGSAGSNAAVPPPAPDAPPPAPEPDAKVEMIKIHAESQPPGATVVIGGLEKCTTPCDFEVVKSNKDVSGAAQLDGYNEYPISFN